MFIVMANNACAQTLVGVQKRTIKSKMALDVGKTKMYRVEAMSVMLNVV